MLKIKRVDVLDGDTLDVELTNGNILLLDLSRHLTPSVWAELRNPDVFLRPWHNGERVDWPNGVSLTLSELFDILSDVETE